MGVRTELNFHIEKVPTSLNFAERLYIALIEKNWANFGSFLNKRVISQKLGKYEFRTQDLSFDKLPPNQLSYGGWMWYDVNC